jgi:DNA-directed RNA polymerase alpha subunit
MGTLGKLNSARYRGPTHVRALLARVADLERKQRELEEQNTELRTQLAGAREVLDSAGLARLFPDLTSSIDVLGLTPRTYNCLRRSGLTTVSKILAKTPQQLLELPWFGRGSFKDLAQVLIARGTNVAAYWGEDYEKWFPKEG